MSSSDPETERLESLDRWENAAAGWGRRAGQVREWGMPVSVWMIEHLQLHPGQRLLELAAGPGDTGFLAAELIQPGGTLVSSDGTSAMLDVARARAVELGITNVEFHRLELEWIDLPTASVDAVLCRWGVMLSVDPETALREARRVLRPGGRIAVAVWDDVAENPWATIPGRAFVSLGHMEPPDPEGPGPFALAAPGRLQELLESTGFVEVVVESVALERSLTNVERFLEETLDLSPAFSDVFKSLSAAQQAELRRELEKLAAPFSQADGTVVVPGRSLVAAASA